MYDFWLTLDVVYTCNAEARSIKTTTTLKTIVGNHLFNADFTEQFSNSDVVALRINDKHNLTYFPDGIDAFFPNIVAIDLEGCRLSSVAASDLAPFHKLQEISFASNRITELPHDLFRFNPRLKMVDLEDNWLMHVGHDIFSNHKSLSAVNLFDNVCTSIRAMQREEMKELIFEVSVDCPPSLAIIEREIFESDGFRAVVLGGIEHEIRKLWAKVNEMQRTIEDE
jgi:hypothetical protein